MNNAVEKSSRWSEAPASGWLGYVFAAAMVLVATLIRLALDPVLGDIYPFITYFGAVAVVAWGVRTGPSVVALLLSGVVSLYLFLPPRYSFASTEPGVLAGLGLFLAVSGVMIAMGHTRRATLRRAERFLAEAIIRRDELERAAEALADQQEQLRITLASIGDAVISTDREGNVIYLNAVAESLTGWTTGEAAGLPLTRVFHIVNESTRQPVDNPALRALTEGVIVGLANHTVLIARDGTERPIDDSAAPIRCKAGEVVGSVLVFRDITNRHRAEAELQRSEERFRATFEQAAVGIAHVSPDGQWLRVNGKLCDILGFNREELLCRTFQDITHPADLAADLAEVGRLVDGEITTYSMEKRYVRRDWSLVWADLTVSLVRTPDGRPDYFIAVVEDITARKESEEASRRSEERLRLARDAVNGLIYECDIPTRQVIVSGGSERLVGVPPGDLTSLDQWDNHIHPDDLPRVRGEADRAFTGGKRHYRIEYRVTHRDGHCVHVWDHAVADRDVSGRAVRVTGHVIDVTSLKRIEERLRASEQQLRLVSDHAPVLIAHCDIEGRYKFVNAPYARRFGLTPDEVVGKRIPDVLGERTYAAFESHVANALAGNPVEFEVEIPDRAGESQFMLAAYTPERDAAGAVVGFVAAVVNITDRRRAEQALRDSEQRMRLATETTKVGIWEWNVVSGEVRWDASMFDIYGVPPTPNGLVQYRDWKEAVLPDDLPQQEAVLHDTVRRLGTSRRAFRIRRRSDGACRHVESVEAVRPNHEGEAEWVVGTNLDVTDREELLRRVEGERGRLADVFRQAPAFMCVLRGPGHVYEMANDRYHQLVGHRDLLGKTVREVLPEVEEQGFIGMLDGVYRTGEPFVGTGVRLLLDQPADERYVDFVYQPLRDPDGVVTGVMVVGVDVTARRQAEGREREASHRLRLAMEAAATGMWDWDVVTNGVSWTPECYPIHGLRDGEFDGTAAGFDRLLHPDDRDRVWATVRAAVDGRTKYECEFRVVRPDGEVRWVANVGRGVYDEQGRPARMVGAVTDITRRKWQEQQVEDMRRSLHAVIERCPFGIYIVDADFRIASVNAGSQEGAFANVRPLIGRPFEEAMRVIWPEPVAAEVVGRFRHTLATGEPYRSVDFVNPRADIGQVEGYEWELHRVTLPDGRDGVVCYYYDSTKLRRAEQEVREAEGRFRTLADNMSQFAWTADERGSIFWYNRRWYEYTGTTPEQMQGWGWKAVHHPDHVDRVVARIQHSWDTGELWEDTFPLRGADGMYRWFLSRAVPIRDGDGRVVRWFGTNTDITDQRELERALRDADRRKDEFLATLAHELRNPLAPIRNGLQVIRMAGANGTIEQARSMMERQLGQMVRLVDDLLDVSRVTTGKLLLRTERVELRAVIDAAVETTRSVVEQAGHELVVTVPDEPIFVDGDLTRLAQVVSNLLTNSAKYTHRGGHIRLSVGRDNGTAVVSVKDDGIGIPPTMLDKVFVMFTQVDRTLEKTTGGLGIGLSLVKGLVEMHGGTIEARSEGEGHGSEFIIHLPVTSSAPALPDGSIKRGEEVVPSGLRRILVVDDNADSADSLSQLLVMLGNEVRTAYDGEAGIAEAGAFRPAVMLCDIGMPKVNGYEAARRIRAESWGKAMVLVALTGWGQEDDRQKSAEAGFDFHLVKPVETASLMKLLAGLEAATA